MTKSIMEQAMRTDGWENVLLGLGGTKDPSIYTTHTGRPVLSDVVLESLFIEDHFAAKIVGAVVASALRPGWDLRVPGDPATSSALRGWYSAREDELQVAAELAQGACWGRLFGGAVTWIGADDGRDVAQPLDDTSIRTVSFLHTFDRRDVRAHTFYQDPRHPKFQKPETYLIRPILSSAIAAFASVASGQAMSTAVGVVVHETRCVVWRGQETTARRKQELQGWDDSVLERCWDALRQVAENYGASTMLLGRISQMIYKIVDLWKMIAGKQEENLRRRMSLLDASRSRARAILLDTREDAVNITQPLGGVPEMIDRGVLRLASAADMPATVLLGQSPAGQNATGNSDLELWAGTVAAWRVARLRSPHERITRILLLSKDAPTAGVEPKEWQLVYRALREPTRKEIAEIRKIEAETDGANIDKGIYTAEDAAFRYAGDESTGIVLDSVTLKEKLERRRALASQPPKDNAELGTVGARSSAALEIIAKVAAKQIPRESGLVILREFFRLEKDVAAEMLGPESFVPAATEPAKPGPAPEPPAPGGAGRPPAIPGLNEGGAP
jgi:hypothetical protein